MVVDLETDAAAEAAAPESAKRTQILEGARRVFFARGFDAASMGEIAREAKVSKGTLYVYFDSKEALFAALIAESKRDTAEQLLELDPDAEDVRTALEDFARRMLRRVVRPEHVALVRVVIGASDKFPALARAFYEAGPAYGAGRLAAWLEAETARGRLAVADPQTAAWQFLGMCMQPVLIGIILAGNEPPDEARLAAWVETSVGAFLAAQGPRAG
jgi:AcrR family transcriptional regulator